MEKKIVAIIALLVITCFKSYASDGQSRLGIGTGLLYENGWDATLSVDKETTHHSSWEFFANVYLKWRKCPDCGHICSDSFWKYYNSWGVGSAYKPCISRSRNNHGNMRIGGWLGSDRRHMIGAITLGYEHSYSLKKNWQVYWQARTEIVIGGKDLFRTGLAIGVKLPM